MHDDYLRGLTSFIGLLRNEAPQPQTLPPALAAASGLNPLLANKLPPSLFQVAMKEQMLRMQAGIEAEILRASVVKSPETVAAACARIVAKKREQAPAAQPDPLVAALGEYLTAEPPNNTPAGLMCVRPLPTSARMGVV